MKEIKRFQQWLNGRYRKNPFLFWIRVTAVAFVVVFFAAKRNFWTPDTLFVVLLALFVVLGQARSFLIRFIPFVALLLVYDSFRGIADDLNSHVHFGTMINVDTFMFGGILPTEQLQAWWWHGTVKWYDFYFYFLYTIHFLVPVLLAVLLWKIRDQLYWPFVFSLILLSFAAFVVYVLFPAAPPWMAAEHGYISVYHVSGDIWAAMGVTNFSEVYDNLSPNKVAAVPSLHSAYPMLVVLFITRMFTWRKAWWMMFYPVSMWVGVVYLGEHYVIDAILGALFAIGAYAASMKLFAWQRRKHWPLLRPFVAAYDRAKTAVNR